jgi:hypothetical protein
MSTFLEKEYDHLDLAQKQTKPPKVAREVNMTQIITVSISAMTIIFTIYSFFSNQFLVDKRKYNAHFYDERYKVLKDITKTISDVSNMINWHPDRKYSEKEIDKIYEKTYVFNYSYLVLDEQNYLDSIVLRKLKMYDSSLLGIIEKKNGSQFYKNPFFDKENLKNIGDSIIICCGKIFSNEKDSINSYQPSFLGF